MKANELPIINFLQAPNVQFVIPVYQRNYDWTNTECKELLNDIISVETENRGTHFIGSIVFVHEGTYSTSEVKELVIIDGQQRLTTILKCPPSLVANLRSLLLECNQLQLQSLLNEHLLQDFLVIKNK